MRLPEGMTALHSSAIARDASILESMKSTTAPSAVVNEVVPGQSRSVWDRS